MTRLTCLLYCQLIVLLLNFAFGWQDAIAVEKKIAKPVVKPQVSNANDERICPSIQDDHSLLRKMLPLKGHKHLKLGSELEGLADRGVSQPCRGIG